MSNRIEKNPECEERIRMEIVVDAYDPQDRAMSWFYYLGEGMQFPFRAKCVKELRESPLKLGEQITVKDIIEKGDMHIILLAEIEWKERTMGVPLEQLEAIDVDEETQTIMDDWKYWVARGYEF